MPKKKSEPDYTYWKNRGVELWEAVHLLYDEEPERIKDYNYDEFDSYVYRDVETQFTDEQLWLYEVASTKEEFRGYFDMFEFVVWALKIDRCPKEAPEVFKEREVHNGKQKLVTISIFSDGFGGVAVTKVSDDDLIQRLLEDTIDQFVDVSYDKGHYELVLKCRCADTECVHASVVKRTKTDVQEVNVQDICE